MTGRQKVRLAGLIFFIVVLSNGCMSLIDPPLPTESYDLFLDDSDENVRMWNGDPVATSVASKSVVELRISRIDDFAQFDLYVENTSPDMEIGFHPRRVMLLTYRGVTTGTNRFLTELYGGMRPEGYAASVASRTTPTTSTTGGFGAYLQGATVGEAILADNQRAAARTANAAARAQARNAIQRELIDDSTLRPGDSLAGSVGMSRLFSLTSGTEDGETYARFAMNLNKARRRRGGWETERIIYGETEQDQALLERIMRHAAAGTSDDVTSVLEAWVEWQSVDIDTRENQGDSKGGDLFLPPLFVDDMDPLSPRVAVIGRLDSFVEPKAIIVVHLLHEGDEGGDLHVFEL